MIIRWTLDNEDELNPADLLGSISFEDETNGFTENLVYLDDWFDAIIRCIELIKLGNTEAVVEIASEPSNLIIKYDNGVHQLSFKDKKVIITSLDDFAADIKNQILSVSKFYPSEDISQLDNWSTLLQFAYS